MKCNAFPAGNGNIEHRIQEKKLAECTLFPTYFCFIRNNITLLLIDRKNLNMTLMVPFRTFSKK